jgi:hypothetical protein
MADNTINISLLVRNLEGSEALGADANATPTLVENSEGRELTMEDFKTYLHLTAALDVFKKNMIAYCFEPTDPAGRSARMGYVIQSLLGIPADNEAYALGCPYGCGEGEHCAGDHCEPDRPLHIV